MNTDNSQTGQQGYGRDQETDQQNQQPQSQQTPGQNAQPIGGNDGNTGSGTPLSSGSSTGDAGSPTGQASYGNSGETDTLQQSQNRSDLGQESDIGQSSSAFIGSGNSGNDLGSSGTDNSKGMPLGTAGGGYGGSASTTGNSADQSNPQASSGGQDYLEQGQGASQDSEDAGTTDIETERSQGRESDIEGSSL